MKDLYGASDVARFCQVDLKTIHNWVEKGNVIPHFRTPGRHLRFKAGDVVAFLKKYGYTMPEELDGGAAATAAPQPLGVRATVEQVFDDGSVNVVIKPSDVAALRALEGREVLLAAAGAA